MRKFLKYGLAGLVLLLVLAAGSFWYWTRSSLAEPAAEALAAIRADERVLVDDDPYLVFRPVGAVPALGLIVYPGANCDVRGYAPLLRRIAARGYLVVGVPMPLNLSVLAPDRADDVREAYPAISRWVIAGHSMGGAMAARYAHRHPDDLAGLILWDSHPSESDTLVDLPYPVWHIHRATPDGLPPEKFRHYRTLFPALSTWVPVPGGNHMNFGAFDGGAYQEEWQARISREQQHDIITTATLTALLAME